jgi:hypothetical protein
MNMDSLEDPMKLISSLALALLPLALAIGCEKEAEKPAEPAAAEEQTETTPAETTPAETTAAETTAPPATEAKEAK